jgi:hypothetical protein
VAYFFRQGAVLATRNLSIDERLEVAALDDGLFSTAAVGRERGFYFAYSKAGAPGSTNLVRIACDGEPAEPGAAANGTSSSPKVCD